MALMLDSSGEAKLEIVFRMYDVDHSGQLDQIEVRKLLENLLTTDNSEQKEEQIKQVISKFDADGDRKVSLDELKATLRDAGFLEQYFGQNVLFEDAAKAVYDVKVKSSMCAVM